MYKEYEFFTNLMTLIRIIYIYVHKFYSIERYTEFICLKSLSV